MSQKSKKDCFCDKCKRKNILSSKKITFISNSAIFGKPPLNNTPKDNV